MIKVNGIELDYNDRTPVSFDVGFMDIRGLGDLTVEGIVTITIRLPRTQKNHLALGHYSSLTERSNTYPYTYDVAGNQVLSGRLMVLQRSRDEISVLLTANSADWIEMLKSMDVRDVDLGSRLFNPAEVVASYDDSTVVGYPFFQFFADQYQDHPNVNVNNFKPAPNISNFLHRLFEDIGYNLELKGVMNDLNRMHILRGSASDADINFEDATALLDANEGIGFTHSVYVSASGINRDFIIPAVTDTIILDEGGNISLVNYSAADNPPPDGVVQVRPYPVYTSSVGAAYRITLDVRYVLDGWFALAGATGQSIQNPVTIIAKVIEMPYPGDGNSSVLVPPATPTVYTTLAEKSFQFTGHIGNPLNPQPVNNTITLPEFVVAEGVEFAVMYYFPTLSGFMSNLKLRVFRSEIKIVTAPTLVSNGLTYSVKNAMPNMRAGDFLRSVIQNFNGIIDTVDDRVHLYCRDEWYLDDADDWTDKIDRDIPIEHITITDIGKNLKFEYLPDAQDKLQEAWRKDNNSEYGSKEVELQDDILFGETEVTRGLRWSQSLQRVGFSGVNIGQAVRINDTGNDDPAPFFNNYRAEDRILFDNGNAGLSFNITTDPVTQSPLPVTGYRDFSFDPLSFDALFPRFWERTINLINGGELVMASVRLTSADMAMLDYRRAKLIRLDDGNIVKAWINKISDMRPGSGRSVDIEFIVRNNKGELPPQPEPSDLQIGDIFQGGVIAHIFLSGQAGYIEGEQHGLIIPGVDVFPDTALWGCRGTLITTVTGFGTGAANTAAIVSGCATAGIAARLCNDLAQGGYLDWVLPSSTELVQIMDNGIAYPALAPYIPGVDPAQPFWTSTEVGTNPQNNAWSWRPNNTGAHRDKDEPARVLPIRYF